MFVLLIAVVVVIGAALVLWQLIEADLADAQALREESPSLGEEESAKA